MADDDVPSPIDLRDPVQAAEWEAETIRRRPYRPLFFAEMVRAVNGAFLQPVTVLDLGSGPGHLIEQLVRNCPVARYVALDFSEAMHALARRRIGDSADQVAFVVRDFGQPHWWAGLPPFDVVVSMQSAHELRHSRHLPALLVQIREVLAPNGLFLYCDHYAEAGTAKHPDLFLDAAAQVRAVSEAGFSTPRVLLNTGGMALIAARR